MPNLAPSAALLFTQEELGGPCVENESYPVASGNVSSVIMGNGDRVGMVIINLGSNPVYISLNSTVSTTQGILLAANGGLITMTVRDDFTLCSRQFWAVTSANTSQLYVLEIARFTTSQGDS